jgi:hypothetical protein
VKECDIQATNSQQIKVLMNEEILIPHTRPPPPPSPPPRRLRPDLCLATEHEAAVTTKISENKWHGVNVN